LALSPVQSAAAARFRKSPDSVWRLLRALYGLDQAGLVWGDCLVAQPTRMRLTRSVADPCLFYLLVRKVRI